MEDQKIILWQLLINNLFAVSQECRDVGFGIARWRYAFSHHIADGHFIVNIEVSRDNVSTVELVANDAGANCVAKNKVFRLFI